MTLATLKQQPKKKPYKWALIIVAMICLAQAQAQTPAKPKPTATKPATGQPPATQPATKPPPAVPPAKPANSGTAAYSGSRDTGQTIDIREKLVQLALQNPNYEIADRTVAIANYQLRKSKGAWLSPIVAQGNLNEFSIQPPASVNGQSVNLYPRYNVGVTIPFDLFSSKTNDIKSARQQLGIAQAQKNQRFREIKAEVLTRYEDYLLFKQKLEFQSQIVQDAESVYMQAEKDFSDGIIKQADYNTAFKMRSQEKTILAEIIHGLNLTKIELEKLIGVPIESVLNN
jgi:outer membrane protein TolC